MALWSYTHPPDMALLAFASQDPEQPLMWSTGHHLRKYGTTL